MTTATRDYDGGLATVAASFFASSYVVQITVKQGNRTRDR